jgi:hypothetical protein
MINNPNAMEVEQFQNAPVDELEAFENAFANMCSIKGGKRKSKRRKTNKRKSRKSRKSRRHK